MKKWRDIANKPKTIELTASDRLRDLCDHLHAEVTITHESHGWCVELKPFMNSIWQADGKTFISETIDGAIYDAWRAYC